MLCKAYHTRVRIFLTKKIAWDILHEITIEVAHLFPHVTFAAVAQTCSEMFNTEETLTFPA